MMNKDAVAKLVSKVCHRVARSWRVAVEDILGRVFLTVYRRLQVRSVHRPEHYVARTARLEARRACREEKAGWTCLHPDGCVGRRDQSHLRPWSVLDEVVEKEQRTLTRAAIDRLPEDWRAALFVRTKTQQADWGPGLLPSDMKALARERGLTRHQADGMAARALGLVQNDIINGRRMR